MTDPSDITAPRDPAAYRPRPMFGVTFWAMLALAVICVLAGVAVAELGPGLMVGRSAGHRAEVTTAVEPPSPAAPVPPRPALNPIEPTAPSADVAKLNARIAILESRQGHAAQAAAAALAAATVAEAAQGSAPFSEELATLRAGAPASPELDALARVAQVGAPSRAALAATFPEYAALAASASHAPGPDSKGGRASLGDRFVYLLSKVVSLRRVGDVPGSDPDALLARAERAVGDGELEKAFRLLDRLPPAARDAMAPWRARAERRAEIDRDVQALRARALTDLAADQRSGG